MISAPLPSWFDRNHPALPARIASEWREPVAIASAGRYEAARRDGASEALALIVFYRSAYLSGDTAPILALADALANLEAGQHLARHEDAAQ